MTSSRPRVLVAEPDEFCDAALELVKTVADVDLKATSGDGLAAAFRDYDVVWFRLAQRIDSDILGDNPRCKYIACAVTGLDHIDLDACKARGIEVLSLKGETQFLRKVRATSELAVGLAMALMRKIPSAAASVKAGVWNRDLFVGRELYEKTAGVIGVGRLGSIVAEYYRVLGMTVLGYDPRPDFPHEVAERVSLEELLSRSDVVSVHAVFDESTRDLISNAEFAQMKPDAVFINTARGGIVDEDALLEALTAKKIAGAALDVLASEPAVQEDNPLIQYAREHDNLLIVPHIGGKTSESMEKTEVFIAEKIVDRLGGDE